MNNIDNLIQFIRDTRIEKCKPEVQEQAKKCLVDLVMVMICGTRNYSSKTIADYSERLYPGQDATIMQNGEKANLLGATLANAAAANALDIDDGYSLTMGHPGAGIIAGILASAEYSKSTLGDVLSALLVGYECAMRQGLCLQDYYNFYHSTGSYAGFGTAAAVGKLLNLTDEQLKNALGIADYYGPLVPCMRTVGEPSLNKDGIYLGAKVGMEAVLLAESGVDGKAHLLGDDKYTSFIDSLGNKWYIFDLYFKFFSCCRWAQGALTALKMIKKSIKFDADAIEAINVYSYGASGKLYTGMPQNETEAQYNMLYPIASFIVNGDFGPIQSSITIDESDIISKLMGKISYKCDPDYEKQFPSKRFTRIEIKLKDGRTITSEPTEPLGEPTSNVTIDEIINKGIKINAPYCAQGTIEKICNSIVNGNYDDDFSTKYKYILDAAKVD